MVLAPDCVVKARPDRERIATSPRKGVVEVCRARQTISRAPCQCGKPAKGDEDEDDELESADGVLESQTPLQRCAVRNERRHENRDSDTPRRPLGRVSLSVTGAGLLEVTACRV